MQGMLMLQRQILSTHTTIGQMPVEALLEARRVSKTTLAKTIAKEFQGDSGVTIISLAGIMDRLSFAKSGLR